MAGHLSGNPGQDAFTQWLHSNYVSREILDKRMESLAADLTDNVMTMLKVSEEAQIAAAVKAATEAQQNREQHVVVAGNGSGIGAEVRSSPYHLYARERNRNNKKYVWTNNIPFIPCHMTVAGYNDFTLAVCVSYVHLSYIHLSIFSLPDNNLSKY